jgi:hypothetical protein
MADEVTWPVEAIPDADEVFMRAHEAYFRDGSLQPGVFRQQGKGMSVDWNRYATPEETRRRATNPSANAVIATVVGRIRNIPNLQVQHDPDYERKNRAHSSVFGLSAQGSPELVETRVKLLRIFSVVVPLD